jgi:uncharacterized protein YihD (DUF1040 family)
MRDPKRINKSVLLVAKLWKQNPDLRFIQLVEWISSEIEKDGYDPFYYEDDVLCELLERMIAD